MKKLIISLLIFSQIAYAEPTLLNKNDPAPYKGILFSIEEATVLKDKVLDLQLVTKERDLNIKENEILNGQLQRYRDHSDKLAVEVIESREASFGSKLVIFLLGSATTILTAFAVSKATR